MAADISLRSVSIKTVRPRQGSTKLSSIPQVAPAAICVWPLQGPDNGGIARLGPWLLKLDADGTMIAAQHSRLDEGAFEARAQGF